MSVPHFPHGVTDQQRDRAISHLQACYANDTIDEQELDRRLDMAFAARDRVELNRSLQGLARMAPAVMSSPRPGVPSGAENVGSGLVHLSGLFTSFVGPAITKAVATPGSRLWWEASRALSLQVTAAILGAVALIVAIVIGTGSLLFLGWVAWFVGTVWASVRAFSGQPSTGKVEPFLLMKPQRPQGQLPRVR